MTELIIVTHNMLSGGCERVIAQLSNWFVSENINCTILTEYDSGSFYELDKRIKIIPLSKKKYYDKTDLFKMYVNLRNYVKENKPDIVLAMPEKVNVWTILFLLGLNIKVVISERNNPEVHPKNKIKRILRTFIYPLGSGFVFQTEQASQYFSKTIRKKSIVLPNPLDLQRIPEPWMSERSKEIVSAGRLVNQKNFFLLINSFSSFFKGNSDYKLVIYGEGPLRGTLEKYASSLLPAHSYSFPGNSDDLLNKINSAEMFILSSDYEGMPNVLIEAMAMGMPVISTDCPSGGPKELIKNGVNGILVPVGDSMEMTQAMNKLIKSKQFSQKIGDNALAIRERLDSEKISLRWLKFLREIAKQF